MKTAEIAKFSVHAVCKISRTKNESDKEIEERDTREWSSVLRPPISNLGRCFKKRILPAYSPL